MTDPIVIDLRPQGVLVHAVAGEGFTLDFPVATGTQETPSIVPSWSGPTAPTVSFVDGRIELAWSQEQASAFSGHERLEGSVLVAYDGAPARSWVALTVEWSPRGVVGGAPVRASRPIVVPSPAYVHLGPVVLGGPMGPPGPPAEGAVVGVGITSIVRLTQAEYDLLGTPGNPDPDPSTVYITVG